MKKRIRSIGKQFFCHLVAACIVLGTAPHNSWAVPAKSHTEDAQQTPGVLPILQEDGKYCVTTQDGKFCGRREKFKNMEDGKLYYAPQKKYITPQDVLKINLTTHETSEEGHINDKKIGAIFGGGFGALAAIGVGLGMYNSSYCSGSIGEGRAYTCVFIVISTALVAPTVGSGLGYLIGSAVSQKGKKTTTVYPMVMSQGHSVGGGIGISLRR